MRTSGRFLPASVYVIRFMGVCCDERRWKWEKRLVLAMGPIFLLLFSFRVDAVEL